MKKEVAKFKKDRQAPAQEAVIGVKAKTSQDKPWRFENKYRDDTLFANCEYMLVDGNWVESERTEYTYKSLVEKKGNGELKSFEYYQAFHDPAPRGKYKTKKSALSAWEDYKKKNKFDISRAIYKVVNIKTKEEIILK